MKKLKMIVAVDVNNGIGANNQLLCRIKEDMEMFKKITIGNGNNAVVMGRKTFESLPNGPLLTRDNYVITSGDYKSDYSNINIIH